MLDPTERSAAYQQWRAAREGVGTLPRPLWAVPRVNAKITSWPRWPRRWSL